jgi:hypothetical protein
MELDKAKLQEVVEKIAYQQTAEDQADDLFNKMGILNKYVQEQLTLTDVVGQSEQLFKLRYNCVNDVDGEVCRNSGICKYCS